DLCRAPVAEHHSPLPDGQFRCVRCAVEMVVGEAEARAVYRTALTAFQHVIGEGPRAVPQLEVVSRRRMGELRQRYGSAIVTAGPATGVDHHILGFFVHAHGQHTIYAEHGLPRALLLGTLAHELGHAWQAERAPGMRDALLCEGFAEWVAYRVLLSQREPAVAARATRRDDVYGRGLRHYLEIERARGLRGVLTTARGTTE
ncbi:MAG: hypothetical protein IVW57_11900, partial [Ktedonobacterales bacterium]|nr:hypothetical protein [Ktedonobacterales bacterium]